MVPESRIRTLTDRPVQPGGGFVLYWMTSFRRVTFNFALQRAAEQAQELERPLLILEALRCDHPWASDRFHRFLVEGMVENARRLEPGPAVYYPYVEPSPGRGRGLLAALAERACLVVTDDFPCFFLPRMARAADGQISARLELVDSNGMLPLSSSGRVFARAYSFRRYLQRELPAGMPDFPRVDPLGKGLHKSSLRKLVARKTRERWPATPLPDFLEEIPRLPIDHSVSRCEMRGGAAGAREVLRGFLEKRLADYADSARHPDLEGTSRLSPYLHYGHISTQEVFREVMRREEWSPARLAGEGKGKREGWWGVAPSAEAFLDQLLTWRELGFHACRHGPDYDRYGCLPDWARKTLGDHEGDPREHSYSLRELREARTHDRIWNAAQNQLLGDGHIHNHLRMLWGKKILEWSPSPRNALRRMITLNDQYALDGRDPNSYSGITWILGRYDRAWGPERPVFGKVRYMSSDSIERKLKIRNYLQRYAP